jgi:hypothetical protein
MSPGERYGRWTVVRHSSPAKAHDSDEGVRARVYVRCVCGHEQTSFAHYLRRGESSGCKARSCKARWEAAQALTKRFEVWMSEWLRSGE